LSVHRTQDHDEEELLIEKSENRGTLKPVVRYGAARGTKTPTTTGINLSGRSAIVGRVPEDASKVQQKWNLHVE
jgi:hypothetical protein